MSSANSRTIETQISHQHIQDQLAVYLYAFGFAKDSEDITNIELGKAEPGKPVPLKYTLKKRKEVRIIRHNG